MADLKAGPVSGYRSHGPERRADASHASPASLGGAAMVRVPFRDVKPLGDPQPLKIRAEVRGAARAIQRGRRMSRAIQQAQQSPAGGMNWRAAPVPPTAPRTSGGRDGAKRRNPGALPPGPGMPYNRGATWTATAEPAYGGAAYNNGGGDLANAMSGSSQPKGIAGPPRPGPGVRVTSKPPTSQARSRAGRDRRADNFKAKHDGPKIIRGTAEDVTPPSGQRDSAPGMRL